jgi:uncharacterized protein YicC (UPF0701 family)
MDDSNAPATKGDLQGAVEQLRTEMNHQSDQLRGEMNHQYDQLRGEMNHQYDQLRGEMQHQYDDLKETLRDSETRLLQAFYGYTQTTDAKLKEGEQSDIALRQRLTAVESRILEVEKRLNMPPAA